MPVVSVAGGALRRALIVAVLIVGLIAMHHLVATGCAALVGDHDHASTASVAVDSSLVDDHVSEELTSTESEPTTAAGHHNHAASASLGGAASLCLAVLVILLVLRRPAAWMVQRFREHRTALPRTIRLHPVVEQPPDLEFLSISRT